MFAAFSFRSPLYFKENISNFVLYPANFIISTEYKKKLPWTFVWQVDWSFEIWCNNDIYFQITTKNAMSNKNKINKDTR